MRLARSSEGQAFRWLRAVAIGFSILFAIIAFQASWIVYNKSQATDFLSYWAAAHLVTVDRVTDAYDIAAHRVMEMSAASLRGMLPFPYPPPFLLFVTPFGWLRYPTAFATWLLLTYALFAIAAAVQRTRLLPFALSQPAVMGNFLNGQNGLLTAALLIRGTDLLERSPLAGGAILGLLVIKPQLAVLVPLALICAGNWKALLGAALSSAAALIVSGLVLGFSTYRAFLGILPFYTDAMARNLWPWNEFASPFAALRFVGAAPPVALTIHAAIALLAAAGTCRAWWMKHPHRAAILAAGAMLVPPYLLTYDSVFLALPIMTLAREGRRPFLLAAIWLLCLLPIVTYFSWYPGPNTIPLASILCLWALHKPGTPRMPEGA